MQAVILIGHGSLRSASGASMIRIAARLREEGIAPLVEAAFLNFSRPTFAEAVAKCAAAGATSIIVQPYFLIAGTYVAESLPTLVNGVSVDFPTLSFQIAEPFCDHPAMIRLARKRVDAVIAETVGKDVASAGLLLMAHGTPLAVANAPLETILQAVQNNIGQEDGTDIFRHGIVGYMECNQPNILQAATRLVEAGATHIVCLPYFLHMGRHVREDLPILVAQAQETYPEVPFIQTQHLDYDPLLVETAADRIRAVEVVIDF